MTSRDSDAVDSYRSWHVANFAIGGTRVRVATKPGVPAHGRVDTASVMLAEFLVADAQSDVGHTLHLNTGNGLVAAAASVAHPTRRVWCADRWRISAQATQRTLEATQHEHPIAGFTVTNGHGTAGATLLVDLATIRVPPEKAATQQLAWDAFHALRPGGRCILAGANDEGVKPAQRMLETLFGAAIVETQHSGHRMVVATKRTEAPVSLAGFVPERLLPDVFHALAVSVAGEELQLFTRPGVFSWSHLDEATALLSEQMSIPAGASVLDLGCGAGVLGLLAATRSDAGRVLLLDADAEAVRCTQRALDVRGVPNAEARCSDVSEAAADERFDVVVTNPPFHLAKFTDLTIPRQFIREAWERLTPGGTLQLVANRTLPYESVIAEHFGHVRTVHDGRRFKVLAATRG